MFKRYHELRKTSLVEDNCLYFLELFRPFTLLLLNLGESTLAVRGVFDSLSLLILMFGSDFVVVAALA